MTILRDVAIDVDTLVQTIPSTWQQWDQWSTDFTRKTTASPYARSVAIVGADLSDEGHR